MPHSSSAVSTVQPGHLYVVATPIGNLDDLAPRALQVLREVHAICAEDTRNSGALLAHFGIHQTLIAVHDHNETAVCAQLLTRLRSGESLALISDAGTPLISDPGFALVRATREAQLPVIAIPGPCAAIAALSIAGLPSDRFVFEGFLPAKSAARRQRLQQLGSETRTLILYESSHRIGDCLDDIVAVLGPQRPVCLARELSKLYEQSHRTGAAELRAWLAADANRSRGEFVLVIAGAEAIEDTQQAEGERVLRLLLADGLSASTAARLAAQISGARKKVMYELALQLSPDA